MPKPKSPPVSLKDILKDTLKAPKTVNLAVPQDDPAVLREVQEFIDSAQKEGEAPEEQVSPETLKKPRVEIAPELGHLGATPQDVVMDEALVDEKLIEVLPIEIDLFRKALISDTPYKITVTLFGGAFVLEIRSRSHYEHRRVLDTANLDRKEGLFDNDDYAMVVTRIQQYSAAIQIERINGELFSEIHLKSGSSLKDDAKVLRDFVAEKLENSNRWTALVNALRVFETKCAKLHTMAANPDFWKPRDQD